MSTKMEIGVIRVDRAGVVTTAGRLSCAELSAASQQDDAELRAIYTRIQSQARKLARMRDADLRVEVVQCDSGVGHRVRVVDAEGQSCLFSLPRSYRRADEGGDHHGGGDDGYSFALAEANEIATRLGAGVSG